MKKCTQCKESKNLTEFHSDKSRKDGVSNRCKLCRCKYAPVVEKKCLACNDLFSVSGNAKAQKYCGLKCQKMHLRYGIDEYKYEDMLISQNYTCAICKNPETATDIRTGKIYELSVDHCHTTGQVRGLLCTNCNTAIGALQDSIPNLLSAIDYLEANSDLEPTAESLQYKHKYREYRYNKTIKK